MTYDQLVDSILRENYFGGSPYEKTSGLKTHLTTEDETEADFMNKDEVKDIQRAVNTSIADRRGGKKKSALQMVDPNQLSPSGREFLEKLHHAADLYKQGSAIGGDAELRLQAVDFEDQAFEETFDKTELDYVGWDKASGFHGAHLYRYPNVTAGESGIPHDKDGFRIEALIEADPDQKPGEQLQLFPLNQYNVANLFAKGAAEPIVTKGKITDG